MSKKTLNQANLAALGAEQLAALLMEVSTGSADIKRRLRLELSHNLGAEELAHELRKRLASLRKSKTFIGWRKRKALIKDLNTQIAMITEKIAPADPTIAFDLLWQFIEIAPAIYARVDDSKGDVGEVFHDAKMQFEDIAPRAQLDGDDLADRVWTAVQDNAHGEWDDIITFVGPALGTLGLSRLTAHVDAYANAPTKDGADEHEAIKFLRQLRGGTDYVAERKARFVKACLQEIATLSGDTDAYINQFSENEIRRKDVASEVAALLLDDDRAADAIEVLLNAQPDATPAVQANWDDVYIACLLAQNQTEEAQAHRWASFLATLNVTHLRDHLKLLPDFDDVEAEEFAKQHVLDFPEFMTALEFCLNWPDMVSAASLIQDRNGEIDGHDHQRLSRAVEALRIRYPLIAAVLLRAMIDHVLDYGQSARYPNAAEQLADCAALDADVVDYGIWPSHAEFLSTLQSEHDRKASFWAKATF